MPPLTTTKAACKRPDRAATAPEQGSAPCLLHRQASQCPKGTLLGTKPEGTLAFASTPPSLALPVLFTKTCSSHSPPLWSQGLPAGCIRTTYLEIALLCLCKFLTPLHWREFLWPRATAVRPGCSPVHTHTSQPVPSGPRVCSAPRKTADERKWCLEIVYL